MNCGYVTNRAAGDRLRLIFTAMCIIVTIPVREDIAMNINGMEIERKYLIAMPDEAVLQSADASEIVQT